MDDPNCYLIFMILVIVLCCSCLGCAITPKNRDQGLIDGFNKYLEKPNPVPPESFIPRR